MIELVLKIAGKKGSEATAAPTEIPPIKGNLVLKV